MKPCHGGPVSRPEPALQTHDMHALCPMRSALSVSPKPPAAPATAPRHSARSASGAFASTSTLQSTRVRAERRPRAAAELVLPTTASNIWEARGSAGPALPTPDQLEAVAAQHGADKHVELARVFSPLIKGASRRSQPHPGRTLVGAPARPLRPQCGQRRVRGGLARPQCLTSCARRVREPGPLSARLEAVLPAALVQGQAPVFLVPGGHLGRPQGAQWVVGRPAGVRGRRAACQAASRTRLTP